MSRIRLAGALVAVGILAPTASQVIQGQSGGVTYHDLASMPSAPFGPMNVKAIVTDTNSFAYMALPPGWHQTVHYHQQEQITMGLTGAINLLVGGVGRPLGVWGAALPPSNVEHGMVIGDGPSTGIEFQAFRRTDWLPPHTAIPQPKSPAPATVPSGAEVNADFGLSSSGWELLTNGARAKSLVGKTIRLTVWDLSAPTAAADLPDRAPAERFVFVLQGKGSIAAGPSRREVGKEMLTVVAPAAGSIQLRSTGTPGTAIAVFESIAH